MIPKTAEQCASSLHHHFEEYVNASVQRVEQARQGLIDCKDLIVHIRLI